MRDFTAWFCTLAFQMKMNRENNLREYRQAYNMDMAPKFGAGSEFGREQREEARRKKYGIYRKRYNPEDQPWHMSLGEGKDTKKWDTNPYAIYRVLGLHRGS